MSTEPRTAYRPLAAIPLSALIVAVAASAVNALIAFSAIALGLPAVGGLLPAAYLTFTAVGAIGGAVGWHLVNRFTRRPSAVLRWLAPAFLVVSFVPDIVVGLAAGWPSASALMLMHVATITIGVAVYAWRMPLTDRRASARRALAPEGSAT